VSSAGKISANRANARVSTGPKTAQGRVRSARNAHRHGLSLPVLADPVLSEEIEALAHEIAGADASSEIQELARRIAEAQIDLRRVRCARHEVISRARGDPNYDSRSNMKKKGAIAIRIVETYYRTGRLPREIGGGEEAILESKPEGPQKFTTILSDMTQRLAAMDRYEGRALVRRKFAIRAFDAARARAAPRVR
jgi:hypothetical protein